MAAEIMMKFSPLVPLVVHWDGKLLPDLTGHESVDWLPVVVTGNKVQQLLGVPKLASGTGQAMAAAVCEILQAWSLTDKVAGMRFDTTASNTGHKNGACPLIEQLLRKQLLYFACRHHIFELVLETVFSVQMKPSSSPDIFIFKRFQSQWSFIDTTDYRIVVDDEYAADAVRNVKDHIIAFAAEQLSTHLPPDDYREPLEITILFRGGTPSCGIHIMAPGALHKVRWMAKAIYAIKIWMFAKQFKLKKAEENALRDVAIFVSSLYVKAWFQAPLSTSAPATDLQFLKHLSKYKSVNEKVSKAAFKKFAGHLWYLGEELVTFAFFGRNVTCDEKRQKETTISQREC